MAEGLMWRGAAQGEPARAGWSRRWLAAAGLALALLALAIGLHAGWPDWGPGIQARLAQLLQRQPTDPRSLIFQARRDMEAQRYGEAVAGYAKAVSGRSKAANDPGVWVEYAEAVAMAQGRQLTGEPMRLVDKALAMEAGYPQALDLAGSAAWEAQDFGKAAVYWKRLLDQLPPGSARYGQLSLAIERAQQRARMALPSAAPQR